MGVTSSSGVVSSWRGQVRGTNLTPPGTGPTYAADGANFGGKPVVQTAITGSKVLACTGLSGFVANGSKPYVFSVYRFRVLDTGLNAGVFDLGDAALTRHYLTWRTDNSVHFLVNNATDVAGPVGDLLPHTAQTWVGTVTNLTVDASAFTAVGATGVSADVTQIGLGCLSFAGNIQPSDTSHAMHLVCSSVPSGAQIAAIKALTLADWGV
jgi:hypothetical protein